MRAVLLAATTLAIVAAGAVMPAAGAQTPDAAPTPIAAPSGEDAGEPGTLDTGTDQNPGLLLAVLVPPVVLVALIWLAYIFRLIFTAPSGGGNGPGQLPDAGGEAPPADADETAGPSAPPGLSVSSAVRDSFDGLRTGPCRARNGVSGGGVR